MSVALRPADEPRTRPSPSPSQADLAPLTRSATKVERFLTDPYVREGLRWIPAHDALGFTFVVLKPEAVAGRRIGAAVEALHSHGFVVAGAWTFRFTRALIRELWRYQLNVATDDRMTVVDWILPSSDSLLLVLADDGCYSRDLPAAAHLAAVKGPADPARRREGQIRTLLRAPTTLLNFMHTADEPADVVRELAAIDVGAGIDVLRRVRAWSPAEGEVPEAEVARLTERLYAQVPAHDLDAASAWERLRTCDHPRLRYVADARSGDIDADWRRLRDAIDAGGPPSDVLWDVISIATASIRCNLDGARPELETIGARAWQEGVTR